MAQWRAPADTGEEHDRHHRRHGAPSEDPQPVAAVVHRRRSRYLWHPTQPRPFAFGTDPVSIQAFARGVWPDVGASWMTRSKYARALSGRPSRAEASASQESSKTFAL